MPPTPATPLTPGALSGIKIAEAQHEATTEGFFVPRAPQHNGRPRR